MSAARTPYQMIEPPDDPQPGHNMLVGILEPQNLADLVDPATPPKILKLRDAYTFSQPGNAFYAIHLGMWDGLGWNKAADKFSPSNSGEATVEFTWDPEAP